MSAPLVVNTRDGVCWTRRTVTSGGIALYAPESVKTCPDFVMATEAELAEHGIVGSADALPMPVREEPQPRTMLDHARDALRARMAKDDLRLVLENTVTYAASLQARVAELKAAPTTVYRASHDSIQMGLYLTAAAARAHCEAMERRAWAPKAPSFDWIEDEEEGIAELTVFVMGKEWQSGYVVTEVPVSAEYDEEADE